MCQIHGTYDVVCSCSIHVPAHGPPPPKALGEGPDKGWYVNPENGRPVYLFVETARGLEEVVHKRGRETRLETGEHQAWQILRVARSLTELDI